MTENSTTGIDAPDNAVAAGTADAAFTAQLAELPPKSRVHEVAKRFGVSSRLLIEALGESGVAIKSSSASVDAAAARTALTALRDSGRVVVDVSAPGSAPASATPVPIDSVDAVEDAVTDALAVTDTVAPADAEAPAAAPAALPVVDPAPWAPLFAEPVAAVAPARPARRRASRPAAPPAPAVAEPIAATPTVTAPIGTAPINTGSITTAPVDSEPGERTSSAEPDDTEFDDLPTRMRVHELAKRAGISAKTLIALLGEQGVAAKSPNSVLARDVAISVLRSIDGSQAADDGVEPVGHSESATTVSDDFETDSVSGDDARDDGGRGRRRRGRRGRTRNVERAQDATDSDSDDDSYDEAVNTTDDLHGAGGTPVPTVDDDDTEDSDASEDADEADGADGTDGSDRLDGAPRGGRRRRRRGGRGGERTGPEGEAPPTENAEGGDTEDDEDDPDAPQDGDGTGTGSSRRRRRRRRGNSDDAGRPDDPADTVVHVRETREPRESRSAESEVQGVRGSTRLEAKRQRRRDSLQTRRRPQILTEAEFLARRESVHRVMAVRQRGDLTQVAVLEDNVLVEHFVSRAGSASMIGNVHLGRVQNVLPSMEAAFVDIGKGRNAVLYAGEVNWEAAGLAGKSRRIESALSSGDTVLVQVSKDPVGHKGARLTTQISLPGRFLVYVPAGGATGISRKLPDTERKRLKAILDRIVPDDAGVIIRTAAEGVSEEELARDVERLKAQWEQIQAAAAKQTQGAQPRQLYSEPDTLIKVIRDLFNSDISELIIDGDDSEHGIWDSLSRYVEAVAPELAPRLHRYDGPTDVFAAHRIDEQIAKALERKVFLPSGGSLVIDRTEAMTVVDVNTGKYTGSGGNLEETVTKNNLEAAEEVVRQLRLRDIGGIIVVDFIDMVLESNRELVLRRLTECLGRDRTRHQVAEVTSLGLVQMTRKKMGTGLVEAFSEPCAHCQGRGIVLRDVPVDPTAVEVAEAPQDRSAGRRNRGARPARDAVVEVEPVTPVVATPRRDPRGPKPPEHGAPVVPAVPEPANELSSALLAELNGRSGEPADVAGQERGEVAAVDPEVLAALLPGAGAAPSAGGPEGTLRTEPTEDTDDTDENDGTDDAVLGEPGSGTPRRRRRGGRGRARRDRGAPTATTTDDPDDTELTDGSGPTEYAVPAGELTVGGSSSNADSLDTDSLDTDEAVVTGDADGDTDAGTETGIDTDEGVSPDDAVLSAWDEPVTTDRESAELEADQLDLLPALDVRTAGEPLDPADAMSDVSVMESSFAADIDHAAESTDEPEDVDQAPIAADTAATRPEPDPAVAPVTQPRRRRSASRPAGPPQAADPGAGLL